MTVSVYSPNVSGLLNEEDIKYQQHLVADFFVGVEEIKAIVLHGNTVAHGPVSQGKDSTVVELMLLEAYRQLIDEKKIEAERPLIISTVDTLNEAIPMKMYTQYCKRRVEDYAKKHGINLFYDIVTPGLNDEYFVKFTGGQKLIPNASRRGDCSIILKVDPSEKYVKKQLDRFNKIKGMESYRDATVISFVGSRTNEGNRRSNNMAKQGIREKDIAALLSEAEKSATNNKRSKRAMLKYAPIRDWSTDNVFDLLKLAGERPVSRMIDGTKAPIPAFLSNFGLLLEIYGNGSNDVCEVVIGETKQGAGCNGKARYGCWNCTMVASTDHSSTALTAYPRWRALGAENALRVRDYLFRLSCDMDARALHARAFDPAGYNRVAMQPNVMKPKYLEKMVRFASQLTVDAIENAKRFSALVAEGREMEHEGYADIANDLNIPPKARKAFLEMYKECAQEPLFTSFSEEHALLLSFRWSIDGIGAAPYRPLAIWQQTLEGKGRIPYPELNSEYEARNGKIKMIDPENPLPEAVMMPIYREEDPLSHASMPADLYDLWERPLDASDVFEADRNCTLDRHADHSVNISGKVKFDWEAIKNTHGEVALACRSTEISNVMFAEKRAKKDVEALLLDSGLRDEASSLFSKLLNEMYEKAYSLFPNIDSQDERNEWLLRTAESVLSKTYTLKRIVPFLQKQSLEAGYQARGRKVKKKINFTRRVGKMVNGVMQKRNTRLTFYAADNQASLHESHTGNLTWLTPNFSSRTMAQVRTTSFEEQASEMMDITENLHIDRKSYEMWRVTGGREAALAEHDDFLVTRIKKRHLRGYTKWDIRAYGGTHVAESLLANGPVVIAPGYWSKLVRILKRTQIFNSLGLFNFQSWNYKALAAHPRAVSMPQHRRDKAEIVQALRAQRNEQRRRTKRALAAMSNECYGEVVLDDLSYNLSVWTDAVSSALSCAVNKKLAITCKVKFDMGDVPMSQKAQVSRLWLTWVMHGVKDVDDLMKSLLTTHQWDALSADPKSYDKAVTLTKSAVAPIIAMMRRFRETWEPIYDGLYNIKEGSPKVSRDMRNVVISYLPQDLLEFNGFEYWNPNNQNAMQVKQEMMRDVDQAMEMLDILINKMQGCQVGKKVLATKGDAHLQLALI